LSSLEVARVTRAHGLRGAVKVALHWAGSDSLFETEELELVLKSGEHRTLELTHVQNAGRDLLVEFAGIESREAAESLIGARIFVPRSALPPLEEGEAYLVDLVGARVEAPDGPVGEVVQVRVDPSVDTLVVRTVDGRLVDQPLLPAFVARVDAAAGVIELANRDGLIE